MPATDNYPLDREVRALLTRVRGDRYRITIFDDRIAKRHIPYLGWRSYPEDKAIAKAERLIEKQKNKNITPERRDFYVI